MRFFALWVMIFSLIFAKTVSAQTDSHAPPLINADEVLTDAAQVVSTVPVVRLDAQSKAVYRMIDDHWQRYPIPATASPMTDLVSRSDGTYLLENNNDQTTWYQFDPHNGTISPVLTECDWVKALPGEDQWVFYQSAPNTPYHLCNTESGALSPSLPTTINLCGNRFGFPTLGERPVYLSPDKQWILFPDCQYLGVSLYAYNIATQKINFLGKNPISDDENVTLMRWADSTHPILRAQMLMNELQRSVIMVDVTKPNSLQVLHSAYYTGGYQPNFVYTDNPPRYTWVPQEFGGDYAQHEMAQDECALHELDFSTLRLTIHRPPIPDVCGFGVPIPDGTGDQLYHTVENFTPYATDAPGFDYTKAKPYVLRFNYQTGMTKRLYNGWVAWIDSVAPSGEFAALTLGSSDGSLQGGSIPREYFDLPPGFSTDQMVILDLKHGSTVFQTELHAENAYGFTRFAPDLTWLNAHTFTLTTPAMDGPSAEYVAETVQIGTIDANLRTTIEPSTDDAVMTYSTERLVQLIERTRNRSDLMYFDPTVKRVIPLICGVDTTKYAVDASILDNGLVDLTIAPTDDGYYGAEPLRHWIVRAIPTMTTCPQIFNTF